MPDRLRPPLKDRLCGAWSPLEAGLFNLVTMHGAVPGLFSNRLNVTQAMLDAYDAALEALTAESVRREAEWRDGHQSTRRR